jgi:hypothetical protein
VGKRQLGDSGDFDDDVCQVQGGSGETLTECRAFECICSCASGPGCADASPPLVGIYIDSTGGTMALINTSHAPVQFATHYVSHLHFARFALVSLFAVDILFLIESNLALLTVYQYLCDGVFLRIQRRQICIDCTFSACR